MPARKRGAEARRARERKCWTTMLSPDTRAAEERRIRRDHPLVAQALDWMSSYYDVFGDGHGFTVFTDWVLTYQPRAARIWPDDVPRFSVEGLYMPIFPVKGA